MHHIQHAKRPTATRPEKRDGSNAPQDELEVEITRDMRTAVRLGDRHGEHGVGDHPRDDHIRAHGAVIVFLLLELREGRGGDVEAVAEVAEGFVVAGVDVELFGGHVEFDELVAGGAGGAEVGVDDVVAFGAPGDVVGVAEGVDLEGADVGGEEGEVLGRGGEHVPGVEVEEGHEEVEADGGGGGDDQVGEHVVAEREAGVRVAELADDDVEGREGGVGHDDGVDDHAGHEHAFGAGGRGGGLVWFVVGGVGVGRTLGDDCPWRG